MKAAFNKVEAPWISFVQIRGLVWSAMRREYKGWAMAEKLEMQFLQCPVNPKKTLSYLLVWGQGKVQILWIISGSKRRSCSVIKWPKYLTLCLQKWSFFFDNFCPFLLVLRGNGGYPPRMLPLKESREEDHPHIIKGKIFEGWWHQQYQPLKFAKNKLGFQCSLEV